MNTIILILTIANIILSIAFITALAVIHHRRPRQYQSGGPGSTQVQSGGHLTVDETALGRRDRIAREISEQIRTGRHL